MTPALDSVHIRALLLDIEGTTSPIEFVYDVLFPYARRHVKEFLERHRTDAEVAADLAGLGAEHARDVAAELAPPTSREDNLDAIVSYVHWLMDRDRKSDPLKSLQGKIWQAGYHVGQLRSHVYADVPPAFARWQRQGRTIAIFSSGSVLAQKLLFAHTTSGDLTGFIRSYFDTTIGMKVNPASYEKIAAALGLAPAEVLFVSDSQAELSAAEDAGIATALCVRSEKPVQAKQHIIHTFDEIFR